MKLVTYDKKTGKVVEEGTTVTDHRGDAWVFLRATRVNQMRYGGHRSGLVVIGRADGVFCEVYDGVCDLEVRSPELEEADQ
jgi:hypothetical protein